MQGSDFVSIFPCFCQFSVFFLRTNKIVTSRQIYHSFPRSNLPWLWRRRLKNIKVKRNHQITYILHHIFCEVPFCCRMWFLSHLLREICFVISLLHKIHVITQSPTYIHCNYLVVVADCCCCGPLEKYKLRCTKIHPLKKLNP